MRAWINAAGESAQPTAAWLLGGRQFISCVYSTMLSGLACSDRSAEEMLASWRL